MKAIGNRILIIAEAGVNHNGDISLAKKLIEAAAACGADMVKFQTFRASEIATAEAKQADYQARATNISQSQRSLLSQLEISAEMHYELIAHCESANIKFFSTGFDIASVEFLASLGANCFKIPSGEITNYPYLKYVGHFGKPVILSTGMANMGEIESALSVLEAAGTSRSAITVLHCNTQYPTNFQDVNLRAMCSIRDAFHISVGYSDHTLGIEVPIAATALGATVIEKHLTLDRTLPGPDQAASLEPNEFAAMVNSIRNIEMAMGDGIKRPTQSELSNKAAARKSLVAAKEIQVGEIFTQDNITAKRPGTGMSPMRWNEIIGRTSRRHFSIDELIDL